MGVVLPPPYTTLVSFTVCWSTHRASWSERSASSRICWVAPRTTMVHASPSATPEKRSSYVRKEEKNTVTSILPHLPRSPPTSSLLEHPPFPPNLILMLSHPPTNLKTHSLPNPSSHLLTLSSPIMTSSMSLQCPSFTLSGLPNVDTISPPRSETLQSCYSVCHLSVEDGGTHAHY